MRDALGTGAVKDLLSGTWLGHAFHPLMTDVPIGAWTSASILDLLGGSDSQKAADLLVAVGLASVAPTVASGWSDWADTSVGSTEARRVGLAHAAANVTAVGLYGASLMARRRGRRSRGRLLALAGAGALGAGGYLGGHLSYVTGVGVDQTAFEEPAGDWTPALGEADLAEGQSERATVAGVEVFLTRREGRVYALSARCTHRGGPLDEGPVENGCVTCPWHGSVFRLADGSIERGPATAPQPAYDVRVRDGQIEIRAAGSAA